MKTSQRIILAFVLNREMGSRAKDRTASRQSPSNSTRYGSTEKKKTLDMAREPQFFLMREPQWFSLAYVRAGTERKGTPLLTRHFLISQHVAQPIILIDHIIRIYLIFYKYIVNQRH